MLIKHVSGLRDADIIGAYAITLTESQHSELDEMVTQRLDGRPVSKIIGKKEFYGREFIVTDDVLDPRPDSETLIDVVLRECAEQSDEAIQKTNLRILDLGTGSGCLILTLLAELPNAHAVATDISDKALNIARQNAEKLGVAERVEFIKSDWFDSVEGMFDIIISNPPYIEAEVIPTLSIDVREYDPLMALNGGTDGLEPYRMILPQIRNYLKKGGFCALEHGQGQCGRIKEIAEQHGFVDGQTHYDLAGRDRVFSFLHK